MALTSSSYGEDDKVLLTTEKKGDKSKDKYAFIVALLAVVLAMGIFKDGLKGAHVSLGFWVSNVWLISIIFAILLAAATYAYALMYIMKETRFEGGRCFRYAIVVGNFIYGVAGLLPLVVLVIWGTTQGVVSILGLKVDGSKASIASAIFTGLTALVTGYLSSKLKADESKLREVIHFEVRRNHLLENVERLYRQKFYTSAIIECYKLVETVLAKDLAQKGYYISPYRPMKELIDRAEKLKVLDAGSIAALKDLKGMRNKATHTIVEFEKRDADFALETTKQLLLSLDNSELEKA